MKILMVCLGNICRSPLAEGVLRHKAEQAGLNWEIDSAGTGAHAPGCAPHRLSQKVAREYGIDICSQVCRQFVKSDMDNFDKVYVMDEENFDEVKRIAGSKWDDKKVDYLLNEIYRGENRSVPDPWYGGEDGYYKVYVLIEKACEAIVTKALKAPKNDLQSFQNNILAN